MKVYVTTPPGLCERCVYGQVMNRTNGKRVTWCKSVAGQVPSDVTLCSQWAPVGTPAINLWTTHLNSIAEAQDVDPRPAPGQVL